MSAAPDPDIASSDAVEDDPPIPRRRPPASSSYPGLWSFLLALLGASGLAAAFGAIALVLSGIALNAAWQAAPRNSADIGASGQSLPAEPPPAMADEPPPQAGEPPASSGKGFEEPPVQAGPPDNPATQAPLNAAPGPTGGAAAK
ncbi:hypothetical protein RB623_09375 [Mesorhizobium sp. LHD-90]|uniref:hypothetical protein n=1 Tax=Mesorhizobium sp. LHD-90 TaxID=3071414 RepID=UPI0027E1B44F|nr:hypothetical protein [Mesorhizobium sp. LHD-90]MDQ6434259.1 hypothetical protein [Mesorhizobium sp. LHD-90]